MYKLTPLHTIITYPHWFQFLDHFFLILKVEFILVLHSRQERFVGLEILNEVLKYLAMSLQTQFVRSIAGTAEETKLFVKIGLQLFEEFRFRNDRDVLFRRSEVVWSC